jgi:hypothetical protein
MGCLEQLNSQNVKKKNKIANRYNDGETRLFCTNAAVSGIWIVMFFDVPMGGVIFSNELIFFLK